MGPDPAVAEVRRAVRPGAGRATARAAGSAGAGGPVRRRRFGRPGRRHRVRGRPGPLSAGAAVVDHGLQEGSAAVARRAGGAGRRARASTRCRSCRVDVATGPGAGGPEAARAPARYAALDAAGRPPCDAVVLLGHTRDDQAETVLLGLGRGSGPRSIAGMRRREGRYLRPFLDVDRATTEQACAALGLPVWHDPHNVDPVVSAGAAAARGAAAAGGRARRRGGRRAGPHRRPAPRRPRRAGPTRLRTRPTNRPPCARGGAARRRRPGRADLRAHPRRCAPGSCARWATAAGAGPLTAVTSARWPTDHRPRRSASSPSGRLCRGAPIWQAEPVPARPDEPATPAAR